MQSGALSSSRRHRRCTKFPPVALQDQGHPSGWCSRFDPSRGHRTLRRKRSSVSPLYRRSCASRCELDRRQGRSRPLRLDDVLIVAPYKCTSLRPVESSSEREGGTVDKFQGQQAPVVIYSLTTSSPEDAPRGMEFLYSLNRLNVATSRAQAVVIVVGSPRLLGARVPQSAANAVGECALPLRRDGSCGRPFNVGW